MANLGTLDRIIRIVLGLALITGYFLNPGAAYRWAYLLGIIPLATGLMGWCALYALFGINTCNRR